MRRMGRNRVLDMERKATADAEMLSDVWVSIRVYNAAGRVLSL